MSNKNKISKITINRLLIDVKAVYNNKLANEGIFYKHDEENLLKGYALIIGPENTPYSYGYFLFKFDFPSDYPYSPPTLTYLTNDGYTRFHPNFYKCGKVCVSILNTWRGEQWSSCQTIRSVLLTLVSLMDEMPLLNEPGISENHKDHDHYNKIITYKKFETGIYKILKKEILPSYFYNFYDIILESFLKNYDKILLELDNYCNLIPFNKFLYTSCYNLSTRCSHFKIKDKIIELKDNLS